MCPIYFWQRNGRGQSAGQEAYFNVQGAFSGVGENGPLQWLLISSHSLGQDPFTLIIIREIITGLICRRMGGIIMRLQWICLVGHFYYPGV